MAQLLVLLALVFAIIIATFAVQNTTPVSVRFLFWQADEVAVSVLVLISAALGAALMLVLGATREVSHRWRQRQLGQQLRAANARTQELERQQATTAQAAPASQAAGEPLAAPELPPATEAPTQPGVAEPPGASTAPTQPA
jgi:uncharacterized integral membrane protein